MPETKLTVVMDIIFPYIPCNKARHTVQVGISTTYPTASKLNGKVKHWEPILWRGELNIHAIIQVYEWSSGLRGAGFSLYEPLFYTGQQYLCSYKGRRIITIVDVSQPPNAEEHFSASVV